jgi:hypothetical protein
VLEFAGLVLVAVAVAGAVFRIGAALERGRREATLRHVQALLAPAVQAVREDPRQFLAWHPVVRSSRRLFPEACAALDAAAGRPFPFGTGEVQEAHAQWTAAWLAWEGSHDGEYTLKAAALQEELTRTGEAGTPLGRARMAALEREKLERYQARYQEYVLTAKALQALSETTTA